MNKIYLKEKYFGIPKNFILLLIIIGALFGIFQLAKITILAPKIVSDRTGEYLFKTINIKEFKAGFGIQKETPSIVFQRNETEIVIELPFRNMTWEKIKKGVQTQSQGYAYEYSILKDEKRKPVGIKEEIILQQPPHLSHFVFPITLKNLDPKEIENIWHFFNISGREEFYIPELFMQDANGETSKDIKIEVNTDGGFIKITPSREWLDHIDRAYPVIIDPSIRIHQPTQEEKDLPNIVNAYVDPVKVVPGDIMLVSAEIMDSHGITQVKANMGDIETIDLELKQGTIHNGIWQAEWLVRDTGPREYTTIITATNRIKKSSSASIVWLDPSWLEGWDNRIKFTIDNTKVDDDLSHFPVTVFLDSAQGEEVFTEFDADADYLKVAFTKDDGVTELYAEKELFAFESVSPTGGTITTNGAKTVHTFLTSGDFTIPAGLSGNVEVLVVAGGGSGGVNRAAGGGAGGFITDTEFGVTGQTYSITVGAGGVAPVTNNDGMSGGDSVFGSLTAVGGGGGGKYTHNGLAGGSGGGAGASLTTVLSGGLSTVGQGNDGGDNTGSSYDAGGGGGAGAVGGNASAGNGGVGGAGLSSTILDGTTDWYAGGGGGNGTESGGAGGTGGGGAGAAGVGGAAVSGTVNTGSGGGGSHADNNAGDGGSGIVIISYITADFLGDKGIYHISKTGWEISSSTDTDFYMYYDNDHADNTTYIGAINTTAGAAVWDSNFKMVQHMVDDTTSTVLDSTSANNDGTKLGAGTPNEVAGKVGQAQEFDGTERIDLQLTTNLGNDTSYTLEAIFKTTDKTAEQMVYVQGSTAAANPLVSFYITVSKIAMYIRDDAATLANLGYAIANNTYYHVAGVRSTANAFELFVNGATQATDTTTIGTTTINAEKIGRYVYSDALPMFGIIDEIRISDINRSTSWVKATYNSLYDTLLTYGSEENYVHPVPADFANRIKLTIDNTKIDSTLTHFPVTVILSSTHGDAVFDHLASDGNRKKIAFTKADGSTQLYGEIEKWDDANESAVIHVSRSGWGISSTVDTDFYMYYDSSLNDNFNYIGDIDSTQAGSVWDSNFKMVQHMVDDTTATVKDSTSNSNDGTKTGAGHPASATGKVGLGQDFDGADDIDIADSATFDMDAGFTLETIANPDNTDALTKLITRYDNTSKDGYSIYTRITDNGLWAFSIQVNGVEKTVHSNSAPSGAFEYIVGVRAADGVTNIYIDGAVQTETETHAGALDITNSLFLGCDWGGGGNPFAGIMDEVRISNITRNAGWIKATYNTLWDTLLTYGTQEDNTAPTAPNTLYSNNANAQAGKANPTGITDTTPVFSAVYNDPDAGDIANKYRIQVATSSDFATTSVFWDSGSSGTSMSNCVQGDRCQDIAYASTTVLALDITKYYWRIKFWDGGTGWDGSSEGAWSTETAHFTMASRELDTSTNADALRSGADRHTFYDGTYYWAFYIDDSSNIVYEKSSDGVTWNGAVTGIATSTTYTSLGIWEDDTYIWTAYNSTTTSYSRKITISDGTLGAEYSTTSADRYHPQIIKDSSNYLWRKEEKLSTSSVELDYMEYANDAAAQVAYADGADTWTSPTLDTNANGWINRSARQLITAATILKSGGIIRVTLGAGPAEGLDLDNVSIVERDGSTDDGITTPTELLFSGVSGVNIGAGATATSDWLTFSLDETKDYLLIFDISSNLAADNPIVTTTAGAGIYYKDGTNSYNQQTVEGFSWVANYGAVISKIELSTGLQSYSEDTIKEQGSYSLKGIATITDSLNSTLVRTVDPTIDLSDLTQIKFDIRGSRTGSQIKIGIHDSGGVTTEITPNIASADTYQTVTWDISGVSNANKDAIDSIIITIVNADVANTFYIDNMYGGFPLIYYAQRSTSVNNDSAWQAETEIGRDSSGFGHMSLTPMGSGKVMALFNDYDGTYNLKYRIYDSSWGASTTLATDCKDNTSSDNWDEYHWFSAVADSSNNVHVVYTDSDDNDLNYIYYNGSSWSAAQEIYTGTATHPSLSYDSTSGNLVAFFIEGNAVKYKVKKSGSWGDASGGTTVKAGLDSPTYLGSAYSDATSIGIIWREKSSSPYAISYAILTLTEARSDIIRIKGGVRLKGGMRLK